jgi:hypothetical protein
MPSPIILDYAAKYLSHFLHTLWIKLGTKLLFSTICHPKKIDGQIEVVSCTLGTMLRVILKILRVWEECLPHVELGTMLRVILKNLRV